MFPNFCGAMGFAGWLAMLVVWAGLVALMVWGIARLFPDRPGPAEPTVPLRRQPDAPPSLIESGRR
jgi:hypothetical protein